MKKYSGEIFLILTTMIWGSGFVASAVTIEHYSPFQVLPVRFGIGVILLCLIFHKRLKNIDLGLIKKGSIIGVFLYIAFALQITGLKFTTSSKNAFLTAVNVIIVPFIAFVFSKRKVDVYEITGALLALLGTGLMVLTKNITVNIGDLLTLCCAFAFAFHIFYTSKYVKNEDPILLTLVQLFTATVLGFLVILITGELDYSFNQKSFASLIYLGIFSTTIAYVL